jgi:hypothetical protein
MSFNSCLNCKNVSTQKPHNHSPQGKLKNKKDEVPKQQGDKPTKKSTFLEEGQPTKLMDDKVDKDNGQVFMPTQVAMLGLDEQGRNVVQNAIHCDIGPKGLRNLLNQLNQLDPGKVPDILNKPDNTGKNTRDNTSFGDTAFIDAIEKTGEKRDKKFIEELVDVLLENGAKPTLEEWKRGLLYCAKLGSLETDETNSGVELFKCLAQKLPNLGTHMDQATAQAVACEVAQAGNEKLMRYMLENPAIFPINVADKDKEGNNLLHHAASASRNGAEELIKLILAKLGSSTVDYINQPNEKGQTPLQVAARLGLLGVVRALLKAGAKKTEVEKIVNELSGLLREQPDNPRLRAILTILQRVATS